MSTQNDIPTIMADDKYLDFLKTQYDNAVQAYLNLFSQLVNIITILVIAEVTLVGFAITEKTAGLLFVGAIFPITILMLLRWIQNLQRSIAYTVILIEDKLKVSGIDGFAHSVLGMNYSVEFVDAMKRIGSMSDPGERMTSLRKSRSRSTIIYRLGLIGAFLAILVFIVAPLVLITFPGWKMF